MYMKASDSGPAKLVILRSFMLLLISPLSLSGSSMVGICMMQGRSTLDRELEKRVELGAFLKSIRTTMYASAVLTSLAVFTD